MKTKINYRRIVLSLAICFAFIIRANAQTEVTDAYAAFTEISGTANYDGTFYVQLTDSVFSELEISLGSSQATNNDIAFYTYSYDVTSGLPSGWTYHREANKLTLEIGQFTDHSIHFGSARVKDTNGQWSSPFAFIGN